ncbi:hypothetical protein D9615_002653 [Tricholomella constricta]|uniref:Uncharacterized protein n=1 Tax=Tricholomella constricta TaxID=117010 RepID=A0A8H5MA00_9AGAR|nr:hypothetical protein D9615_002653 [Tricholomella constricta]
MFSQPKTPSRRNRARSEAKTPLNLSLVSALNNIWLASSNPFVVLRPSSPVQAPQLGSSPSLTPQGSDGMSYTTLSNLTATTATMTTTTTIPAGQPPPSPVPTTLSDTVLTIIPLPARPHRPRLVPSPTTTAIAMASSPPPSCVAPTRLPPSSDGPTVIGAGIENDGVFANVMAKPQPSQVVQSQDGSIYMVPKDKQKEAAPSYSDAQADAVPPYWETTVHTPLSNRIDGKLLATGGNDNVVNIEYKLKLDGTGGGAIWESKHNPVVYIRAKYQPYDLLRQRFWHQYLMQYVTDDTQTISHLELTSMLDLLGSTLTRDTVNTFFTTHGKRPHQDDLTFEEAISSLEAELGRPDEEKRRVDVEGGGGMDTSVSEMDFSGPPHVEGAYATQPSEVPLSGTGAGAGTGAGTPGYSSAYSSDDADVEAEVELEEGGTPETVVPPVSGAGAGAGAEAGAVKVKKTRFRRKVKGAGKSKEASSSSGSGSNSGSGSGSGSASEDTVERVINVKNCPLCHRPRMNDKAEVDIVTHLAVCASQDWNKVDRIVVGNFVTASQAQRKWYTKIITKVSSGNYRLGANSANIIVQNRMTGQLEEEEMQVYVRLGIRLLYKGATSRMEGGHARCLLKSLSIKQGIKYDAPQSALDIPAFIEFHGLNVDEILDPLDSFKTFNEFFYRKLKPSARPIEKAEDSYRLVSAADCRLMTFATAAMQNGRNGITPSPSRYAIACSGIIFSSLTLFTLLRLPLMFLPVSFSAITDAANATSRQAALEREKEKMRAKEEARQREMQEVLEREREMERELERQRNEEREEREQELEREREKSSHGSCTGSPEFVGRPLSLVVIPDMVNFPPPGFAATIATMPTVTTDKGVVRVPASTPTSHPQCNLTRIFPFKAPLANRPPSGLDLLRTQIPLPQGPYSSNTRSKPTSHLPGDHGDAPGKNTSPAFPSDTLHPTPDVGWFPSLSNLVSSQKWFFGAIGAVALFGISMGIFFWHRRKARLANYTTLPAGDDMSMSALAGNRSGVVSGSSRPTGELYDAFREVSDDDKDNDEGTAVRGSHPQDRDSTGLRFHSGFLDDDEPS